MQEIIWRTKPDLIIETGIAHGGSLVFHASMLQLLGGDGHVVGIDVEIRKHNRSAVEEHPLFHRIELIEGSSIDPATVEKVRQRVRGRRRVMVVLDSNHTHDHVLRELELYAPLVTAENYLVVLDTVIEDLPKELFPNRPWDKGNNPKTAVHEFLKRTDRFSIDKDLENKLLLTVAPDGYLRCLKD
jgi:cephalosporin hydroxylase